MEKAKVRDDIIKRINVVEGKGENLNNLVNLFNKTFGTVVSKFGIRDKRLRLLGKKR